MTHKLVLASRIYAEKAELLKQYLTTDWQVLTSDPNADPDGFQEVAADADAIVAGHIACDLPQTSTLKLYQVPFTGYDFLSPEILPVGCKAANTYEHETAIAEYILLAMLEWQIGLRKIDREFREKSFQGRGPAQSEVHGEVRDRTVGIIGYGHIGKEVAQRARAFGMKVVGTTRTERPTPPELDWLGTEKDIERLLGESDFVVLCCPLNDQTRGLMNSERFGQMKPDGVVINVARGAVIDEDALWEALSEKRIGGAVIDVWYRYPRRDDPSPQPSKHPLQTLDNIIMTPHNSGWTAEQIDRRWRFVAANLDRLARGENLENVLFEGTR